MNSGPIKVLQLKRREEHRLRNGHPWVFSNEVDTGVSPLAEFQPGELAEVKSSNGRSLGTAQVNPKALICARLISRAEPGAVPEHWVETRLADALSLRQRLFEHPYYRLVYGESDGLPGVVVDRHGDVLAVQLNTVGAQAMSERLLQALSELLAPAAVVMRNDSPARALEGLGAANEVAVGALEGAVEIVENGARFSVDPLGGQKTGWYYDQRDNRARAAAWSGGARVLDLFSFSGGWGVQCALKGAARVTCVDSSASALEGVAVNAALNGVKAQVGVLQGDVFKLLRDLRAGAERYDLIIADPPAFIRRRKDQRSGLEAYRRLNTLAMQLLAPDGILVSASCSSHLSESELLECVRTAAAKTSRRAQVLGFGSQGPDHPVLAGMPESRYIKAVFTRTVAD